MRFEADAAKSAANKAKHGMPRFLLAGQIAQVLWTARVTYRHEETIRLISVRRARDREKTQYLDAPAHRCHASGLHQVAAVRHADR